MSSWSSIHTDPRRVFWSVFPIVSRTRTRVGTRTRVRSTSWLNIPCRYGLWLGLIVSTWQWDQRRREVKTVSLEVSSGTKTTDEVSLQIEGWRLSGPETGSPFNSRQLWLRSDLDVPSFTCVPSRWDFLFRRVDIRRWGTRSYRMTYGTVIRT